jgi:hypothetical protein
MRSLHGMYMVTMAILKVSAQAGQSDAVSKSSVESMAQELKQMQEAYLK